MFLKFNFDFWCFFFKNKAAAIVSHALCQTDIGGLTPLHLALKVIFCLLLSLKKLLLLIHNKLNKIKINFISSACSRTHFLSYTRHESIDRRLLENHQCYHTTQWRRCQCTWSKWLGTFAQCCLFTSELNQIFICLLRNLNFQFEKKNV